MYSTQLPQPRPRSSFQFGLSSLVRLTVALAVLLAIGRVLPAGLLGVLGSILALAGITVTIVMLMLLYESPRPDLELPILVGMTRHLSFGGLAIWGAGVLTDLPRQDEFFNAVATAGLFAPTVLGSALLLAVLEFLCRRVDS